MRYEHNTSLYGVMLKSSHKINMIISNYTFYFWNVFKQLLYR